MRVCTRSRTHSIAFTRAVSPVWLEGKIDMSSERNAGLSNIEHDFETLNHGVDAGILSFPSRYVRGNACSAVNFTISFKPLSTLNGRRIAFGKVRKGMQFLDRLQDAIGHLPNGHEKIVLTDCGVLQ